MEKDMLEMMRSRRSIRKYTDKAVPKELIDKVIEAGLYAASGMNRQDTIIIAVTDKAHLEELSKTNASIMGSSGDPFYGAQAVLIVLADKSAPTYIYDGSLTIGNMLLEAHALGLGSCWIHRAKEEFESPEGKAILKKLGIDGDYEGIGHVALGYTDGDLPDIIERKPGRVYYDE